MTHSRLVFVLVAALAAVAGCSSPTNPLEGKKIDYKSAGKGPSLEVPPDLTQPGRDDRYTVPDVSPQGTATYSAYARDRGAPEQAQPAAQQQSASPDKVRIERAGTQRWLVVNVPPAQAWPVIRQFWQETGFIVDVENQETGVMETDWAENRANIPQDFIRNTIGKLVDGMYSTAERDKFRTRVERSPDGGTEIYISHRGVSEVYTNVSSSTDKDQTKWQARPADPDLEAEMLARLMTRFGVEEAKARQTIAGAQLPERARLNKDGQGGGSLALGDPFDRAWRRVGLALDRIGFTVEDRDRSKGVYFVRYADPEAEAKSGGLLSKLAFWKSSDPAGSKPIQYRVVVQEKGQDTLVRIEDPKGAPEKSQTGTRILTLLYEQLR